MLKRIFTLIVLTGFSLSNAINASDEEGSDEIHLGENGKGPNHPKSQSYDTIKCYKVGAYLTIILPENIFFANVTIYNDHKGWIGSVTKEMNSIMIPLPSGIYTIEVYTNDGRIFTGIINL